LAWALSAAQWGRTFGMWRELRQHVAVSCHIVTMIRPVSN
jgi:hypothetical protein